ncbi:MAG: HEAT repeat domain-containing protein [bacterium]|nr:HEAT repeat domain-containing protein [bacterium]
MKKTILMIFIMLNVLCASSVYAEGDIKVDETGLPEAPKATRTAEEMLSDTSLKGRDLLAYDYFSWNKDNAAPFLAPFLAIDPDPEVRSVIAEGLGTYGDATIAVSALLKAREDKFPRVREKVADSLIKRGHEKESVDILLGLIKEKEFSSLVLDNLNNLFKKEDYRKRILEEYENIIQNKNGDKELQVYAILALKVLIGRTISKEEKDDIENSVLKFGRLSILYVGQLTQVAVNDPLLEKYCLSLIKNVTNSPDRFVRKYAEDRIKDYDYIKRLHKGEK